MWIFTRYGFYSIACALKPDGRRDAEKVMVRARCRDHLDRLLERFQALAGTAIIETPSRDYGYRIVLPKRLWADILHDLAMEQEWSNFKSEVARHQGRRGKAYQEALHDVWGRMAEFQNASRAEPPTPSAGAQRSGDRGRANAVHQQQAMGRFKTCPKCGERSGIPIVYGEIGDSETIEQAERGEIAVGGCCVTGHDPDWRCRNCGHEWRAAQRGTR